MRTSTKETIQFQALKGMSCLLTLLSCLFLCLSQAQADVTVTATGAAGVVSQTVPGAGGAFGLSLPLSKNAVNTITVSATDASGNKVSQDIKVTQLSLDQIVVSQVTAERLSVQQIKQLVADGVIKLDNPANYNVSKFDIVLTIGDKQVPISVPIVSPVNSKETIFEPVCLAGRRRRRWRRPAFTTAGRRCLRTAGGRRRRR